MPKANRALSVISAAVFALAVPALLPYAIRNLDSLWSVPYALGIAVISLAFFRFAKFESQKGRIVTLCLLGLWLAGSIPMYLCYSPSIRTLSEIRSLYPDISPWDIHTDKNISEKFTVDYIFYNEDNGSFNFNEKPNLDSIAIIAFYTTDTKKAAAYYEEVTGEKYADVTAEVIHIRLINPETKQCFASDSFSNSHALPQRVKSGDRISNSGIAFHDPAIISYIENFLAE